MRCFNDYLTSSIGTCSSIAGAMARAYLIARNNITGVTISDAVNVSFVVSDPTDIIPVYIDMDMPYKLGVAATRNEYGLTKVDKTVEIFIAENTPLTQKQVIQLHNDGYVLIIMDNNGQTIGVGIERGLRFVSSSQEISSTETHGGIVVTMSETAVNHPMLFCGDVDIVPVTGLSVDATSVALIGVGDTDVVNATVLPDGITPATVQTLIVGTGNAAVATATVLSGVVTITSVGVGITTVTVRTIDGNYKAEIIVTVTNA